MRARGPRKVVYAGDGSNDLCPSLRLGEGDCVLARRGHALAAALTGSHAGCVAARVRLWSTHDELHALVREEVGSAA
jgi:pyridoxal phosphate phosphatase PHOSPHO2